MPFQSRDATKASTPPAACRGRGNTRRCGLRTLQNASCSCAGIAPAIHHTHSAACAGPAATAWPSRRRGPGPVSALLSMCCCCKCRAGKRGGLQQAVGSCSPAKTDRNPPTGGVPTCPPLCPAACSNPPNEKPERPPVKPPRLLPYVETTPHTPHKLGKVPRNTHQQQAAPLVTCFAGPASVLCNRRGHDTHTGAATAPTPTHNTPVRLFLIRMRHHMHTAA